MSTEIIDLAAPLATQKKKIELVACFKDFKFNKDNACFDLNTYRFSDGDYSYFLKDAKQIKRLSILNDHKYPKLQGMSLIEVDGAIFLGLWNDGVI